MSIMSKCTPYPDVMTGNDHLLSQGIDTIGFYSVCLQAILSGLNKREDDSVSRCVCACRLP